MTPQVISLSAAGSTAWIPVDYKQNPFNIDVAVVLSNTPNLTYKVEYTLDDIFDSAITPTAFSHSTLTGLTANAQAPILYPVRAIRLTITAWTSGTATMTALQGAVNPTIYTSEGGIQVFKFPGFVKSLLASLVVSSTASRTSNIVTITATAHGITTGATYVGFRFFYPGSPSLVAGWYDSIVSIPDANTITFNAPGTDFGSESINAGAAYTTLTSIISTIVPANTLRSYSRLTSNIFRSGDTTATIKNIRNVFGGTQLGLSSVGASPHGTHRLTIHFEDGFALSAASQDAVTSNSLPRSAMDLSIDQTFAIFGSVSAASGFLALHNISYEIVK